MFLTNKRLGAIGTVGIGIRVILLKAINVKSENKREGDKFQHNPTTVTQSC